MTRKILISALDFEVEATLLQEERPKTCDEIWKSLPLEGKASIFKEEIYFDIPVDMELENATPKTEKGDVSYWPDGPAFCIFYGDSQPVSPVNTFAKIEKNIDKFKKIESGDRVTVRKIE